MNSLFIPAFAGEGNNNNNNNMNAKKRRRRENVVDLAIESFLEEPSNVTVIKEYEVK